MSKVRHFMLFNDGDTATKMWASISGDDVDAASDAIKRLVADLREVSWLQYFVFKHVPTWVYRIVRRLWINE